MSVWTNWDPLEAVIVGDCYAPGDLDWAIDPSVRSGFNQILIETKQDLNSLADTLTALGVTVYRPHVFTYNKKLEFSTFTVNHPTAPIVPRDQYLVYGDTVYQTYTSMSDRYVDSTNYYHIFQTLFEQGYNWISQPPPNLPVLKENDKWWLQGPQVYRNISNQLLWHTATMFKCGDALITNTRGPGTSAGLEWMRRNVKDGVIVVNNKTSMSNWGHIDHGFFMTDDDTVFCDNASWVPMCLKHKHLYEIGHLLKKPTHLPNLAQEYLSTEGKFSAEWIERWLNEWKGYDQAVSFDTNALVVDSKNIVFTSELPELFDFLKTLGITAHCCHQRHAVFWESGVHCFTLDVKRRGEKRKIVNEV